MYKTFNNCEELDLLFNQNAFAKGFLENKCQFD